MNFSIQSIYNWYRDLLRNPKYRWWVVAGSIVYLVSPIDISPDVFPIIGWLDDGIVISLLIAEVSQLAKEKLQAQSTRSDRTTKTTVEDAPVDVKAVTVD
ncbi:YkvA family protein [Chamaesiphon sp. GL140_3_metabinner_50]|uniref:YkvA family protein n=1 Tax=Chamaesiphon sp. GL140_3_metabinner_50 TaxID=2970812 RepID=UPI0025F9B6A5|nr:YkvA family protein [Chamaesiphon sp. GL140_3_metabinner_50]